MLVTNYCSFFIIGRLKCFKRLVANKIFSTEFSNQVISVKVQDHPGVSQIFHQYLVGDTPAVCKEWQHSSHRNKLASCDILLPINVKFHVTPKLWLDLLWFWTCPHFQDCEVNLQVILTIICILISWSMLTDPSLPAQDVCLF